MKTKKFIYGHFSVIFLFAGIFFIALSYFRQRQMQDIVWILPMITICCIGSFVCFRRF